jgi:hypothetical protein
MDFGPAADAVEAFAHLGEVGIGFNCEIGLKIFFVST